MSFKKNPKSSIGLEIRLKVPFTAFKALLPMQTILLSDLVGCDSPQQIVMAVWRILFYI
jgi:hypothetical protein